MLVAVDSIWSLAWMARLKTRAEALLTAEEPVLRWTNELLDDPVPTVTGVAVEPPQREYEALRQEAVASLAALKEQTARAEKAAAHRSADPVVCPWEVPLPYLAQTAPRGQPPPWPLPPGPTSSSAS